MVCEARRRGRRMAFGGLLEAGLETVASQSSVGQILPKEGRYGWFKRAREDQGVCEGKQSVEGRMAGVKRRQ